MPIAEYINIIKFQASESFIITWKCNVCFQGVRWVLLANDIQFPDCAISRKKAPQSVSNRKIAWEVTHNNCPGHVQQTNKGLLERKKERKTLKETWPKIEAGGWEMELLLIKPVVFSISNDRPSFSRQKWVPLFWGKLPHSRSESTSAILRHDIEYEQEIAEWKDMLLKKIWENIYAFLCKIRVPTLDTMNCLQSEQMGFRSI